MSMGFQEILLIFVVVLLIFGAKRIPEIARALGRAQQEFKKAKEDLGRETDTLDAEPDKESNDKKDGESGKQS